MLNKLLSETYAKVKIKATEVRATVSSHAERAKEVLGIQADGFFRDGLSEEEVRTRLEAAALALPSSAASLAELYRRWTLQLRRADAADPPRFKISQRRRHASEKGNFASAQGPGGPEAHEGGDKNTSLVDANNPLLSQRGKADSDKRDATHAHPTHTQELDAISAAATASSSTSSPSSSSSSSSSASSLSPSPRSFPTTGSPPLELALAPIAGSHSPVSASLGSLGSFGPASPPANSSFGEQHATSSPPPLFFLTDEEDDADVEFIRASTATATQEPILLNFRQVFLRSRALEYSLCVGLLRLPPEQRMEFLEPVEISSEGQSATGCLDELLRECLQGDARLRRSVAYVSCSVRLDGPGPAPHSSPSGSGGGAPPEADAGPPEWAGQPRGVPALACLIHLLHKDWVDDVLKEQREQLLAEVAHLKANIQACVVPPSPSEELQEPPDPAMPRRAVQPKPPVADDEKATDATSKAENSKSNVFGSSQVVAWQRLSGSPTASGPPSGLADAAPSPWVSCASRGSVGHNIRVRASGRLIELHECLAANLAAAASRRRLLRERRSRLLLQLGAKLKERSHGCSEHAVTAVRSAARLEAELSAAADSADSVLSKLDSEYAEIMIKLTDVSLENQRLESAIRESAEKLAVLQKQKELAEHAIHEHKREKNQLLADFKMKVKLEQQAKCDNQLLAQDADDLDALTANTTIVLQEQLAKGADDLVNDVATMQAALYELVCRHMAFEKSRLQHHAEVLRLAVAEVQEVVELRKSVKNCAHASPHSNASPAHSNAPPPDANEADSSANAIANDDNSATIEEQLVIREMNSRRAFARAVSQLEAIWDSVQTFAEAHRGILELIPPSSSPSSSSSAPGAPSALGPTPSSHPRNPMDDLQAIYAAMTKSISPHLELLSCSRHPSIAVSPSPSMLPTSKKQPVSKDYAQGEKRLTGKDGGRKANADSGHAHTAGPIAQGVGGKDDDEPAQNTTNNKPTQRDAPNQSHTSDNQPATHNTHHAGAAYATANAPLVSDMSAASIAAAPLAPAPPAPASLAAPPVAAATATAPNFRPPPPFEDLLD
eukprot:GHVT01104358.1.p1 GENE.GHVT01104358.1~~GHVT01104358.1.p1  ORF type:complete len:1068 (-),score=319.02 GHVT01104358.1:730-3933(-)